jgi:hypothetical protein
MIKEKYETGFNRNKFNWLVTGSSSGLFKNVNKHLGSIKICDNLPSTSVTALSVNSDKNVLTVMSGVQNSRKCFNN